MPKCVIKMFGTTFIPLLQEDYFHYKDMIEKITFGKLSVCLLFYDCKFVISCLEKLNSFPYAFHKFFISERMVETELPLLKGSFGTNHLIIDFHNRIISYFV